MTTKASLERLLLRRSDLIDRAKLQPFANYQVRVSIQPKEGVSFEDAKADVHRVLRNEGSVAVRYNVAPFEKTETAVEVAPSSMRLASFASDQTANGLKQTLIRAVPPLGKAVFEVKPGESVRILVAYEDGTSSPALVERVRSTLASVSFAGLPFFVEQLPLNHSKNDLANAGCFLPRRDADIVKLTEEDEDIYATKIHRLLDGKVDEVPLVDKHVGARVLTTGTLTPPLPLSCLLPLYDRIFVQMPLWDYSEADYYQHHFGTSEADFIAYCHQERVVPIFKFNLGNYPRRIVEPWLNNYALPFLSPRTFDYVALRHVWQTSPYLQLLRGDSNLATELSSIARSAHGSKEAQNIAQMFSRLLNGSEFFEGLAWHRGHLAVSDLSSGGGLGHTILRKLIPHPPGDKNLVDNLTIDTFTAISGIATAQAFDASLTEGMLLNESILQRVLPYFRGAETVFSTTQTAQLKALIDSLELNYSGRIPAKEYLDILNQAETRRIRKITHALLNEGDDGTRTLELRELVRKLNNEVAKIEKNALETTDVDVVGDLAKVGANIALNSTTLGAKLTAASFQRLPLKRIFGRLFEKTVDETRIGDALDKIRGAINGVSPEAIRIYRIRRKLQRDSNKK